MVLVIEVMIGIVVIGEKEVMLIIRLLKRIFVI